MELIWTQPEIVESGITYWKTDNLFLPEGIDDEPVEVVQMTEEERVVAELAGDNKIIKDKKGLAVVQDPSLLDNLREAASEMNLGKLAYAAGALLTAGMIGSCAGVQTADYGGHRPIVKDLVIKGNTYQCANGFAKEPLAAERATADAVEHLIDAAGTSDFQIAHRTAPKRLNGYWTTVVCRAIPGQEGFEGFGDIVRPEASDFKKPDDSKFKAPDNSKFVAPDESNFKPYAPRLDELCADSCATSLGGTGKAREKAVHKARVKLARRIADNPNLVNQDVSFSRAVKNWSEGKAQCVKVCMPEYQK